MKSNTKAGIALSLAVLTAGCGDFLSGPGLTENPNSATEASTTAQFVAIQANMMTLMEGQLARFAGMYTQQIIGSNNQQQVQGTQYGVVEGDVSGFMSAFYTGAGLVGLRKVQAAAKTAGDAQYEGIAKIWEAYAMGTAASIWGDLPYSEANDPLILTPKLDTQQGIYTAVIALLDNGITLLGGAGPGPGATDLVYGGNTGRWIRAANTLKARFLLHLVERDGNARYTQAIAAANLGINEAPTTPAAAINGQALGDFRALHGSTLNVDANIWAQFLGARQDIVAGDALVAVLKARTDPRLTAYFDVSCIGTPATSVCGMDRNGVSVPAGSTPSVVNTVTRRSNTFRQPFITWAETQLILAEAKFQTGDAPGALINMNNVRTAVGLTGLGAATLQDIMLEKYIAMFQNIDVWSDYKRTCIPAITPFSTRVEVLGRLPYGSAERTNNPNIPLPASFPTGTSGAASVRNWNDPNRC